MNATHFHNLKFFLFGRDLRVQSFLLEKMGEILYIYLFILLTGVNFHLTAIFKFKNELGHGSWVMDPFWATQL